MTPGPKFSTSTSAFAASRRSTSAPPLVFRSRTSTRLLRFIIMKAADSPRFVGGAMRRVSSPPGLRSILITSAPMSASIIVQVGPAITWVRSMTFRPASGPIVSSLFLVLGLGLDDDGAGRSPPGSSFLRPRHDDDDAEFRGPWQLRPAPVRRAFFEEGPHPLAEILAHVAHQDQVLALLARQALGQAPHRFLGGAQCQRRVAGDGAGKLVSAGLQRARVLDHLGEKTEREGLAG